MDSLRIKIQKNSKTMANITKILCISLIVGLGIPISVLIRHALSPNIDFFALHNVSYYSSTGMLLSTSGELIAEMWTIIVSGTFVLYILYIAYRMFQSIGKDVMPFSKENADRLKKTAILLLIYSIAEPIAKAGFYRSFAPDISMRFSLNIVSVILAFVFFFISVVFAYGAELQRQYDETL